MHIDKYENKNILNFMVFDLNYIREECFLYEAPFGKINIEGLGRYGWLGVSIRCRYMDDRIIKLSKPLSMQLLKKTGKR